MEKETKEFYSQTNEEMEEIGRNVEMVLKMGSLDEKIRHKKIPIGWDKNAENNDYCDVPDIKEAVKRLKEKDNEVTGDYHMDIFDTLTELVSGDITRETAEFLIRAMFDNRVDEIFGKGLV